MKTIIRKLKYEIKFILCSLKMLGKDFGVSIMSIEDTLRLMADTKISVIRFGDGEFSLIGGRDLPHYQKCTPELWKNTPKD